jgi:UPF0716 protein FxsA
MLAKLFILFVTIPLLEVFLLVKLAHALDWPTVLGIVVLTAMLGAHLSRREGLTHLRRIQRSFAEGRNPAPELLEGLMILIAAVLLITPGLITDSVGFLLLIPATRRPLRSLLQNWLKRHFAGHIIMQQPGSVPPEEREVINVTPEHPDEDL